MSTSKKALAKAYADFCRELSVVLYEEDPDRMGITVGAPQDEYEGIAAGLAATLREVYSRDQIAQFLKKTFGNCPESLLGKVEEAVKNFRAATGAGLH